MTPVEVAMAIDRSSDAPGAPTRDPETGLYVLDGTVPPTAVTPADYERGMNVLLLREKVAIAHAERDG